tara:strand:- start:207 stop:632 length:426 start_codon:yes stop_codon:yes gene_type:complete
LIKCCTRCGEDSPITNFHKKRTSSTGLDPWCKQCKSVYRKQYFIDNQEKETIRGRLKAWKNAGISISIDSYRSQSTQRNNKCDICAKQVVSLHVDHSHTTGKLRGLLCGSCNRALGLFQDNPDIINKAKIYLDHYEALSNS